MVTGDLGVLGDTALCLLAVEQEQDLGAATTPLLRMGGKTAVDHLVHQKLATV